MGSRARGRWALIWPTTIRRFRQILGGLHESRESRGPAIWPVVRMSATNMSEAPFSFVLGVDSNKEIPFCTVKLHNDRSTPPFRDVFTRRRGGKRLNGPLDETELSMQQLAGRVIGARPPRLVRQAFCCISSVRRREKSHAVFPLATLAFHFSYLDDWSYDVFASS